MSACGSITEWINSAAKFPLLTPDEELQLGAVVQTGQQEGATPRQKKARERAIRRLVSCNLRLVVMVSKKYSPRLRSNSSMEMADLLQEMTLGLHRAAEKFEPKRGYKFSTYAYWWLRQSAQRALDQSGVIKTPTNIVGFAQKMHFLPAGLSREEIKAELGLAESTFQLVEAHMLIRSVRSLDALKNEEDDSGFHEILGKEGLTLEEIGIQDLLVEVMAAGEAQNPAEMNSLWAVAIDKAKLVDQAKGHGITRSKLAHNIANLRASLREQFPEMSECFAA